MRSENGQLKGSSVVLAMGIASSKASHGFWPLATLSSEPWPV